MTSEPTANLVENEGDGYALHVRVVPLRTPGGSPIGRFRIFGGRGYMQENVAERFYREVRVDRIWEGTSEVQRQIIGYQLSKQGTELSR